MPEPFFFLLLLLLFFSFLFFRSTIVLVHVGAPVRESTFRSKVIYHRHPHPCYFSPRSENQENTKESKKEGEGAYVFHFLLFSALLSFFLSFLVGWLVGLCNGAHQPASTYTAYSNEPGRLLDVSRG